ncbi:MAG: rhodanese-like domain-containing protein [Succinivibrionaceae bacterium]
MDFSILDEVVLFAQNHYVYSLIWVVSLIWIFWIQINLWIDNIKVVDQIKSIFLVNNEGYVYLDVRTSEEYKKGHIIDSIFISITELQEKKFNLLEKYKNVGIVVVGKDFDDINAYNSAKLLKKNGFKNVYLLDGGLYNWQCNNLPLSRS